MWISLGVRDFLLKKKVDGDLHQIFVSDCINIWYKYINSEDLISTSKELNPLIEAPNEVLIQKTLDLFNEKGDVNRDVQVDVDVCLELKSKIGGFIFKLKLKLQLGDAQMLYKELTSPLLIAGKVLQGRAEKLAQLLKKKDAEIEEYKSEGAVIKRSHLVTEHFIEEEFKEQELLDSNLFDIMQKPILFFDSTNQDLMERIAMINVKIEKAKQEKSGTVINETVMDVKPDPPGYNKKICDENVRVKLETDEIVKKRRVKKHPSKLRL